MRKRRLSALCLLIAAASILLHVTLSAKREEAPPTNAGTPTPAAPSAALRHAAGATAPERQQSPRPAKPTERTEPPRVDPDRAMDLFADLFATLDTGQHDPGNSMANLWKRFDRETPDAEWSSATTPKIRSAVEAWIHSLPGDVRDHIALVQVECRSTLCQVLVADNDPDSMNARSTSSLEWASASDSLLGQPWWNESGFLSKSYQMTVIDGYALTTTYLGRTATAIR